MIPQFGMTGMKFEIFKHAAELICRNGYHAVSMKDIAVQCGLTASSLYNYFAAKEDILEMIYHYYNHYYLSNLPDLDALLERVGVDPPQEIIRELLSGYADPDFDLFMNKLVSIICVEMLHDERASVIMKRTIYEIPGRYFYPLLNKMFEKRIIEPFDVDTYLLIHGSISQNLCTMTAVGTEGVMEKWKRYIDFQFKQIMRLN